MLNCKCNTYYAALHTLDNHIRILFADRVRHTSYPSSPNLIQQTILYCKYNAYSTTPPYSTLLFTHAHTQSNTFKLQIVDDIMRFPAVRQPLMTVGADESADAAFSSCGTKCNGFTTPDVLQQAYSFGPVKTATKGNSMSVAEFQLQYYDQPDLDSFSSACGVDVDVAVTIGGNQPKICEAGGCVEALLDIEYIGAVAGPIPLTVLYLSSYSLLDWVDQVTFMIAFCSCYSCAVLFVSCCLTFRLIISS